MSKIVLITSGPSIAHYGRMLQKSLPHPEDFLIIDAYMEEALDYARNQLPEDTDVIIARGNTAKLLKSAHLSVPVVTIPIRDSEIIYSVQKARELYGQEDSKIAYLGLEDVLQAVRGFLDILHYNIRLYSINSSEDIRSCIRQAKREHIHVVIGGIYTQKAALEAGLDCVLLESSLPSVKEAYGRALEVQKGFILQKKKFQERTIFLNSITDGIISINEKGRITECNPAAEKYLSVVSGSVTGKSYSPLFSQTEKELIQASLISGKQISDHPFTIENQAFYLSIHPVSVGSKNKGIVLTLRPSGKNGFLPPVSHGEESLLPASPTFFDLTGSHPAFQLAVSYGRQYAPLTAPVLLIGEEGTGKETMARCMHEAGSFSKGLFISREAALLTEEDILAAHGGTLYIRNGHLLSPSMQELFTDILRTGSFHFSNQTRQDLSFRLMIGSDVDLSAALSRHFYYMVNSLILPVPALRHRAEDIPALAAHILTALNKKYGKCCQGMPDFFHDLKSFSWPGNLRQLESYLRRLVLLSHGETLFSSFQETGSPDDSFFYRHLSGDLPAPLLFSPAAADTEPGFIIKGRKITYQELKELDSYYQGKKGLIAEKLGVSRSTLWRYYREMEKAGIVLS